MSELTSMGQFLGLVAIILAALWLFIMLHVAEFLIHIFISKKGRPRK